MKKSSRDLFLERVKDIMNRQVNESQEKLRRFVFGLLRYLIIVFLLVIGLGISYYMDKNANLVIWLKIIPLSLGILLFFSMRIVWQWEKAVVLRLGRFCKCCGPGPFFVIPVIDNVVDYVDQRIRVTDFTADTTLTKDTVPVYVDAIIFWMVWDPQKAILEVENYFKAVVLSAKTSLRDIIGKHDLADLLSQREKLGQRLQGIIDEKTNPWGITALSIEIKDIIIPEPLEEAMSKEAQAERERRARILLGTAETEIAQKFSQASAAYQDNPVALQLRGMNMLYEGLKEKGSMVIVPASALESMNLGKVAGLTAMGNADQTLSNSVKTSGRQKTSRTRKKKNA